MNQTVYIDTTIPSYHVDSRPRVMVHIERTREWWAVDRHRFEVFISPLVLRELEEGDFPRKADAVRLLNNIPILTPTPEIARIVDVYIENFLMPMSDDRDAYRLAFASYYKIDYLLTWNCAHLANVNKRGHILAINQRLGLFVPQIVTPLELIAPEGRDNND